MSKSKMIWIGAVVVIVLILGYSWTTYNSLVTTNENVDNQWAQVETQYQRRLDLIPNLVNSVKGIMSQEQTVFGAIADARTRYAGAITVNDKAIAASQVESAFGRLLAVMENYPELKSAENVQTLMAQLEGTENRVSVERKRFNDMVRDFNLMTKRFPSSVIASMFGFSEKAYFESAPGAENAPAVEF